MEIMNENEEKIRSTVMNLLRHHFGIPEYDAKDILQDAWLLLLEKLATGALSEVPTKLQSYMTTVCTNKAHEYRLHPEGDTLLGRLHRGERPGQGPQARPARS